MAEQLFPLAAALARENEQLRQQLQEADDLITAIRTGTIDALAVQAAEGPRIFTLEGADQTYRTLIEQMNEGALLLSQNETVLYGNACLAALLGRPLEAVIGASFQDFVPSELRGYWAQVLAEGWAGRSKGEMPLETADSLLQPFALALNRLEEFGDTPMLAIIVTDLADKREISTFRVRVAEQNDLLARQNEELREQARAREAIAVAAAETSRILEGIPQMAWTADAQGEKTYLNQRWRDYTGERPPPPGQPATRQVLARLHPDDLARKLTHWGDSLRSGTPMEVECRIRDAAGEYRWMLARALPALRDGQQGVTQWVGTYTDIHDYKLTQEREAEARQLLHANNEQLTRVNVDLDNFIYTASHDLRAPIANIEGLVHVLQDQLATAAGAAGELTDEMTPVLGMMQDSIRRFQRTIEHLTEVTKLQKEHDQPATQLDLATVVHDVLLDLDPQVRETHAHVEVDLGEGATIAFSLKNLRSVVYNLLSNALKYRRPDQEPRVCLRCHREGDYTVLTVQDNGLGLDDTQQAGLFAMFRRFHTGIEGSGIGLYMVKKIVENAGGKLTVESAPGEGSTFSVYFRG